MNISSICDASEQNRIAVYTVFVLSQHILHLYEQYST